MSEGGEEHSLEETHTYETTVADYCKEHTDYSTRRIIEMQAGSEVTDDMVITVMEVKQMYN